MDSDDRVSVDWSGIDADFEGLEPRRLLALLSAAADSPGCGHRLPSLSVLWARAISRPPLGNRKPGIDRLEKMLATARSAWPPLIRQEDWWPPDPRLAVRYKAAGERFEFHPGLLANPVGLLRDADDTAIAIDDEVARRHGFRLSDLIELTLRYADLRLRQLRPAWPTTPLARDLEPESEEGPRERIERIRSSPTSLSDLETEIAMNLLEKDLDWIAQCTDAQRGRKAWDWATQSSQALQFDPAAHAPFGSAMAASTSGGLVAFPASLMPGFLASAVSVLAAESAESRKALRRMRGVVSMRVMEALGMDIERGGFPVVQVAGKRHAYVFSRAAGLDEKTVRASIRSEEQELRAVTVRALRSRSREFSSTGHIYPVLVVGGPFGFRGELNSEIPGIQLQELIDLMTDVGQMTRSGGAALFWQFIQDLHESRGQVRIASDDLDDVWRLFLDLGSLNPAAVDESMAIPNPTPSPSRWELAADWEPYEAALSARDLPPRWRFKFPELDKRAGVATMWHGDAAVTIGLNPPLITVAELNRKLAEHSLDPAFGLAIADGIRLTIRNFGLWQFLQIPLDKIVLLTLKISDSADVGIGLLTDGDQIGLTLGLYWFQLLAQDATQAHSILGQAMAECLIRLKYLDPERRIEFVDHWEKAPPVAYLMVRADTLQTPRQGRLDLPRTVATRAWADGFLARSVRGLPFESGIYVDESAAGALQSIIKPAINHALGALLAKWSPAAVMVVAGHLNDAHAERFRRETELEQALRRPWADTWRRDALEQRDASEMTRPVEILMELLLLRSPKGRVTPDQFDVAQTVDLVNKVLEIALISSAAKSGMHGLIVGIDEVGVVNVFARPGELDGLPIPSHAIDLGAFIAARRLEQLQDREPDPESEVSSTMWPGGETRGHSEFVPIEQADMPKSFYNADHLLKVHLGMGINGLIAIMGTAVNWHGRDDKVRKVARADLLREAQAWSGLPVSEIGAALDRLLLKRSLSRGELEYWKLEGRSYRLSIRPLIELDDGGILLVPWLIHTAQTVYLAYLLDGRVPWPASELSPAIVNAFVRYRQVQNKELQRRVAEVATGLGFVMKERILENLAAKHGVVIKGDIDALIADTRRKRLWVCEVKDPRSAVSPSTISSGIEKFLEPRGYVDQLRARSKAVEHNPGGALQLLGLNVELAGWTTRPLMITRRIEPAGFAYNLEIPFVTVAALGDILVDEP
ncbi:MAG TPA: hypothetical protein DEV93_20880 [Chloroflexi bacterium]|nr:hypothetical protein [Chloroflexota bacterium]